VMVLLDLREFACVSWVGLTWSSSYRTGRTCKAGHPNGSIRASLGVP
jgi:hypothetical protein